MGKRFQYSSFVVVIASLLIILISFGETHAEEKKTKQKEAITEKKVSLKKKSSRKKKTGELGDVSWRSCPYLYF